MKIVGSSFLKYVVAAIVAVTAISYVSSKRTLWPNQSSSVATREFNHPEDADESWIGPPIGERIELVHLKDERGKSLSEVIGDGFSMLVLVDPGCAAPVAASNQLARVHDAIKQIGVQHYVVSITASVPSSDFFAYAHSMASDSPAFVWVSKEAVPAQKLYSMVIPSHLLIDKNGVIVRKWPGTSNFEEVRYRMANEIIADTRSELASRE